MTQRPPHNLDAERSILGCCLLDRKALTVIMSQVEPDDLFHPPHRIIFEAMREMYLANVGVDYVTLHQKLVERNQFEQAGSEYIAGLTNVVPSVRNAEHYAEIIVEASRQRGIIALGNRLVRGMESEKTRQDSKSALNDALSGILEIETRTTGDKATEFYEATLDAAMASADTFAGGVGIKTGFDNLDKLMRLMPGDVFIVAAITSQGKTAFVSNIAVNAARQDVGVLFISLEMSVRQMAWRLQSYVTTVPISHYKFGQYYNSVAQDQLTKDMGKLSELSSRVYLKYMPDADEVDIMRTIKVEKLLHPNIGLVIVDYVQNVSYSLGKKRFIPLTPSTTAISKAIKKMAGMIGVSIISVSQLSRFQNDTYNVTNGDGKKQMFFRAPRLDRLRESGALEQDADQVLILHLKENIMNDAHLRMKEWEMDGLLLKQRNGPTGKVPMLLNRNTTTFREIDEPPIKPNESMI